MFCSNFEFSCISSSRNKSVLQFAIKKQKLRFFKTVFLLYLEKGKNLATPYSKKRQKTFATRIFPSLCSSVSQ